MLLCHKLSIPNSKFCGLEPRTFGSNLNNLTYHMPLRDYTYYSSYQCGS